MSRVASSTYPSQVTKSFGSPLSNAKPYVVAIFGHTGVGISSLVNLIIGHPVSNDHPNAQTSRQRLQVHPPVTFPGSEAEFCLYEVPGFHGNVPDGTIFEVIRHIEETEGIDLFIYCLRKQKKTVMPSIVRHIRERIAGANVPMIAIVTELERFEEESGAEDWWDAPLESGSTNGAEVERMCFDGLDKFDAHACVTTLPWKDVDLLQTLRKRRERSEERVRRLILEQCSANKRRGE